MTKFRYSFSCRCGLRRPAGYMTKMATASGSAARVSARTRPMSEVTAKWMIQSVQSIVDRGLWEIMMHGHRQNRARC